MKKLINKFLQSEDGATALEYAMIATLISIVILATVQSIGTTVQTSWYDNLLSNL